jgi:hypothetical protein
VAKFLDLFLGDLFCIGRFVKGGPQTQIGTLSPKSHFGIGHFKTWAVIHSDSDCAPLSCTLPTFTMKVFSLDTNLESDAITRTKAARRSRNAVGGQKIKLKTRHVNFRYQHAKGLLVRMVTFLGS